jgi:hypothetical protein
MISLITSSTTDPWGELQCTCRITLVTNLMINFELGKDGIAITLNGTYSLSFVKQIFNNG